MKPFLLYDFATAPLWISLFIRNFIFIFYQCIQHWFICHPSDSAVTEDAGIKHRTIATFRHWQSGIRSNHSATSHSPFGYISTVWHRRRKIRLIESSAKCCYLKKFACKGTLRQVCYLSVAPSPPMTPYSPPYTLYTCTKYTYSHGGGGGGATPRQGAIVHKAFWKKQN